MHLASKPIDVAAGLTRSQLMRMSAAQDVIATIYREAGMETATRIAKAQAEYFLAEAKGKSDG